MNDLSGANRRLALAILEAEFERHGESAPAVSAVCADVLADLHLRLQPMVGDAGVRVLVGRAWIEVARHHPGIGRLESPEEGPPSRDRLERMFEAVEEAERKRTAVILVSEFLSFLARLVGWGFTLTLLRERWPDLAERYADPATRASLENP